MASADLSFRYRRRIKPAIMNITTSFFFISLFVATTILPKRNDVWKIDAVKRIRISRGSPETNGKIIEGRGVSTCRNVRAGEEQDGDSHRVMDGTRGILYRGISSPPLLLIKLFGISRGRVTRQCRPRARRKTRGERGRSMPSCAPRDRNF